MFKIFVCSLFLNTVFVVAVSAQPNRTAEAQLVADAHPNLWTGSDNKRQLTGMICTTLNRIDGGMWGLMSKDERNPPYVPEDVLMWRPTRAHIDVLSDSGAVPWIVHTETPTTWSWISCGAPSDPPVPIPGPIDPILGTILTRLGHIEQAVADIRQQNLDLSTTLIMHENREANEREAAEAFRQAVGSEYKKFGIFVAKYVLPLVGGILGGKYLFGGE